MAQIAPDTGLGWPDSGHAPTDTIQAGHLGYEARGSILVDSAYDGTLTNNGYDGLGHLRWLIAQNSILPWEVKGEKYTVDPLGNMHVDSTGVAGQEVPDGTRFYNAVTGRLDSIDVGVLEALPTSAVYDAAGNQIHGKTRRAAQSLASSYNAPDSILLYTNTQYAYDALARLRFVKQRWDSVPGGLVYPAESWTDEETRYDALGRRVWVATNHINPIRDPCGVNCTVTHYVWDGDQVLLEFRQPDSLQEVDTATVFQLNCISMCSPVGGVMDSLYSWLWGEVGYVHGMGLDQPLAAIRIGGGDSTILQPAFPMYPHANWQGNLTAVSFDGGNVFLDGSAPSTPPLPNAINASMTAYGVRTQGGRQVLDWTGSLLSGQVNETGLAYKRNRYYDPQNGQFTQEDPIGLAGGVNAYGYANGDPVTYSDPFGLSPDSTGQTDSTKIKPDRENPKHKAALSTCENDAGKFGLSLLMNVTGLGMVKYLKSAVDVVRVGKTLGTISEVAWQQTGGAFVAQAMYTPAAAALHSGLGAGGTNYHFDGLSGLAYTVGKATPVVGAGLELGEAIHSCSNVASP